MTRLSRRIAAGVLAVAFAGTAVAATASNITGAGSTFVYPVLAKWAADYKGMTGDQINYQSIGSGGGIAQIKAGTVDFGATDKPLSPEELAQAGLAQFPVAIGGVVPVVNIAGLKPGQLRLSGPVLADIYDGRIKTWNDPQIARLNPGLHLPAAQITAVHRSDGSGTTFNFTHYLSQVNGGWKASAGEGTSVNWPGGVGGKGNEGVATYVKQIPNAIGYVEYAYVLQNHMTYALMRNAAGQFVAPNTASFQAAAATADWAHSKDFYLVMTNAPGPKAYPITASTFVLMYKHPRNAKTSLAARKFFRWALEKGQKQALSLDYVPLPGALVKHIEAYSAASFK
ncbi:phosphate ABC transporter substrate-binding protein PstS [Novosphingobium sp. 1949]|uniref:Phosphate-binding protein PstS n=1 Tax=Novosphingobium organovorum TaxID=2930092 RepID=A0ABT0BFZ2_9SPHN|nr:phosphate ABC transporter substrate-binding protein PstS [Novosphingobium organovorum]MCJ2183987.1 phosphate ABC transporter substrate-binding protein PstS [Novosphingobium organovorum]